MTTSTGVPPWPMIVTSGGQITEWSVSFESIAAAGVSLGTPATVWTEILHASALATSPGNLGNINLVLVATMDLETTPLAGLFTAYTRTQILGMPITIETRRLFVGTFFCKLCSCCIR